MKALELYEWDLMDETGVCVVNDIVEDEDEGPTKEWGPWGVLPSNYMFVSSR